MELRPEDVTLLERHPHFRGWYEQTASLLESCPHFRGWYVQTSRCVPIRQVSSFNVYKQLYLKKPYNCGCTENENGSFFPKSQVSFV